MDWIDYLACDSCKNTYCRINNRSEMKEKILEILKNRMFTYQLVEDSDPIILSGTEASAEEITAMVMEFVEWKCFDDDDFEPYDRKGVYINIATKTLYDTEHLFNYWLTNIYKK
jgi:hypothetical protein